MAVGGGGLVDSVSALYSDGLSSKVTNIPLYCMTPVRIALLLRTKQL